MADFLLVDRQTPIGRVLHHDLAECLGGRRTLVGLERKVDVHPPLRQRQCRQEDDQQHEQDVDERRDVHVGRDFGRCGFA